MFETCLRSPDGWQSATRFSRLGGIRNNHFLTSKPEATCVVCVFVCMCACKDKSESHFTSPDICCRTRGRADVSRRVCWLKLLAFWRHVQALSVCPSDLISIWCMLPSHKQTRCILVFKHTEINVSAFRMGSWSASYNKSATTCTMELKNNIKQILAFGT